jgi:internalin A
MALVLIVGGVLGWFMHRVTVQRDAVKAIVAAGGNVKYDFEQKVAPLSPIGTAPRPNWLVEHLGVDFFADVTSVTIGTPQTDAILFHVGSFGRLERLDARSVRVTDAGLAHLAGLSELRTLLCSGTPGLTDAGLAHLAGLKRLETLWIEAPTGIEGSGMAHLAGLRRLKFLCVHNETDAGLPKLTRLTGLRRLFISVPKVTDESLAQLAHLTSLEELAFGGESGSDAGMSKLRSLTNLKILQLHGPWFSDAGLAPVSEMDHLSTFFASDHTSVTTAGLTNLQQQRPALRIDVNGTGRVDRARLDLLRRAVGPAAILTQQR